MKNIKYNFAVITENFPPCAGGGIAEWALGVSENLSRFGHKVTVYSKWKGNVDLNIHNDKMFNIKRMRGHDWRKFRFWYSLYYIRKFLKTNPNGVILATSWELGHPFVFLKRRFPKAKLITIAHGLEVTKINTDKKLESFQQTINNSQLA
ncbi:MAG: hypothetical protein K8R79_08950, partial [Calditrichales bacterium]|nr:hypothetical protein [Calditrichales bacterium]